ncbi:MAG TPA: DUF11 domain-containing protein [Ilumatobacteraceae bacterium]|nr:DUF11 domain-containing protein [Ilumatobacteraceae bacterium]
MRKGLMAGTLIAGAAATLTMWSGAADAGRHVEKCARFGASRAACLSLGDLTITKTDGVTEPTAGDSITYTIVVTLASGDSAINATVADTLPAAIQDATWTCAASPGASCTSNGSGNVVASVSLPLGGSAAFTVHGTLSTEFSGELSNTATVTAPQGYSDTNGQNNYATDVDMVKAAPVETGESGAGLPDNGAASQTLALLALAVVMAGAGLIFTSRRLAAGRR